MPLKFTPASCLKSSFIELPKVALHTSSISYIHNSHIVKKLELHSWHRVTGMEKCFSPSLICLYLSEVLHLSLALCVLLALIQYRRDPSFTSIPPPATSIILSYVLPKNNWASAWVKTFKEAIQVSFIRGEYLDGELASQDPMHTAPSASWSAHCSWCNTSSWCRLPLSEVAPAYPSLSLCLTQGDRHELCH